MAPAMNRTGSIGHLPFPPYRSFDLGMLIEPATRRSCGRPHLILTIPSKTFLVNVRLRPWIRTAFPLARRSYSSFRLKPQLNEVSTNARFAPSERPRSVPNEKLNQMLPDTLRSNAAERREELSVRLPRISR